MSPRSILFLCLHIFNLSFISSQYFGRQSQECSSVSGEAGTCIPISRCRYLEEQYRRSDRSQQQYLIRQYACGFRTKEPVVCCPLQGNGNGFGGNGWNTPPNRWPQSTTAAERPWSWGTTPDRRPTSTERRTPPAPAPTQPSSGGQFQHRNRKLLPEKICGISLAEKILGGTAAGLDEFPWMALLQYQFSTGRTTFGCGGSLISARYVLTAAHCINGPDIPSNLKMNMVRLGEFDTSKARDCQGQKCAPAPQDIEVEKVIVHKEYRPKLSAQYNDIALIRLRRPATFTTYVTPICIPFDSVAKKNYEGQHLVVAGWGRTRNERGSQSDTLQKVAVPVVRQAECAPFYNRNNIKLRNTQLCAGGESKKDSCSGDSGGPLMSSDTVGSDVRWHVTGVVSFGPTECGKESVAGIYTKVSEYAEWILDNMKD